MKKSFEMYSVGKLNDIQIFCNALLLNMFETFILLKNTICSNTFA